MYIHTISHPPYILPIHIFLFLHSHVFLHIYPFYPITSINCSCISHPFHLYPKIHPLLSLSISITFYIPPTYIFTLWFSTISTRSHYTFQHFTFALSIIFHITSFIPPPNRISISTTLYISQRSIHTYHSVPHTCGFSVYLPIYSIPHLSFSSQHCFACSSFCSTCSLLSYMVRSAPRTHDVKVPLL